MHICILSMYVPMHIHSNNLLKKKKQLYLKINKRLKKLKIIQVIKKKIIIQTKHKNS